MKYKPWHFGILNMDEMAEQPLILLDGGIESRFHEPYDYTNDMRNEYSGYVFQYTLNGEGRFEKHGRVYPLSRGTGFLVKVPENSRYYLPEAADTPWDFFYLHFSGPAAAPFFQKLDSLCGCVFSLDTNSPPVSLFMKLYYRLRSGDPLMKYEGQEFLYSFLCRLLSEVEQPESRAENSPVHMAIRIMKKEYHSLAGIEEISVRLGISQEHLTRCFRSEQGIPPARYLTTLRIQAAMNELLDTDHTIHTIALHTGFSNGNYFSKVFRKYTGMSPGEYREHYVL